MLIFTFIFYLYIANSNVIIELLFVEGIVCTRSSSTTDTSEILVVPLKLGKQGKVGPVICLSSVSS